jgi:hypothetical protein
VLNILTGSSKILTDGEKYKFALIFNVKALNIKINTASGAIRTLIMTIPEITLF